MKFNVGYRRLDNDETEYYSPRARDSGIIKSLEDKLISTGYELSKDSNVHINPYRNTRQPGSVMGSCSFSGQTSIFPEAILYHQPVGGIESVKMHELSHKNRPRGNIYMGATFAWYQEEQRVRHGCPDYINT